MKKTTSEKDLSCRDSPISSKRKCTDILFLILLVSSWLVMIGIGLVVTGCIDAGWLLKKGNPNNFRAMDYLGNICGVTNFTDENNENILDKPKAYSLFPGLTICIESCPHQIDLSQFHCRYDIDAFIIEQANTVRLKHGDQAANNTRHSLYLYYTSINQCMPLLKSGNVFGYCFPTAATDVVAKGIEAEYKYYNITTDSNFTIANDAISGSNILDEAIADTYLARHVILAFGIGGALLLGFLYLNLLRVPGVLSIMIWSMVIAISALLGIGGYYMRETSIRWNDEGIKNSREVKGMYWLSVISFISAVTWFLIICAIRKRIQFAIAIVKEAASAVSSMPILIAYPALPVFGFVLFLIPWMITMVYLLSTGEITSDCMCLGRYRNNQTNTHIGDILNNNEDGVFHGCDDGCFAYRSFRYEKNTKYAALYFVFTFCWTSQFIIACVQLCVACSISMWYFTRDKHYVGNHTFFRAFWVVLFYHSGTCAFGSLIIAVVKTIRVILAYVQKKVSKVENTVAKALLMSIQCCLCLLERCIKFISKNAYIQTAIHGHSFCKGAREAYYLIMRNIVRVSVASVVSEIILISGKLLIVVSSTVGAYFYLDNFYEDQLRGLHTVTSCVFLIALITAELFNQIFATSISTIIHTFVTDEESYEADNMFAPGKLASVIDETQKAVSLPNVIHPDPEKKD